MFSGDITKGGVSSQFIESKWVLSQLLFTVHCSYQATYTNSKWNLWQQNVTKTNDKNRANSRSLASHQSNINDPTKN